MRMESSKSVRLTSIIAAWYDANKRDLPWRQTRDPYRVWISEIMLQQTRVAAVIPYYERFLQTFPSPKDLAAASDDELLKSWSGLGYYSRARNLRESARRIVERGAFPATYDEILELPGIGPYTAAAIASICFDEPKAVLDGNVIRVLARITADEGDVGSSKTKQRLQVAAQKLIDVTNPARHNQAMMELGATVCLPKDPKCCGCPVEKLCKARLKRLERQLPVKKRQIEIRRVRRTLLVVIRNGHILLWRRSQEAALLGGFWELPEPNQLPVAKPDRLIHEFSHAITNRIYEFEVMTAKLARPPALFQWVLLDQLKAIPLSTVARKALASIL